VINHCRTILSDLLASRGREICGHTFGTAAGDADFGVACVALRS
jgi:hypothetical protein